MGRYRTLRNPHNRSHGVPGKASQLVSQSGAATEAANPLELPIPIIINILYPRRCDE